MDVAPVNGPNGILEERPKLGIIADFFGDRGIQQLNILCIEGGGREDGEHFAKITT